MSWRKLIFFIYSSATFFSFLLFSCLVWFGSVLYIQVLGALSFFLSPSCPFFFLISHSFSGALEIFASRSSRLFFTLADSHKTHFPGFKFPPTYLHTRKKLNLLLSYFTPSLPSFFLCSSPSSSGIITILVMFSGVERVLYNH